MLRQALVTAAAYCIALAKPSARAVILGQIDNCAGGDARAHATVIRLYPSAAAECLGEPRVASLGVDNIEAIRVLQAIPEPGTAALAVLGLVPGMVLAGRRRRARRKA